MDPFAAITTSSPLSTFAGPTAAGAQTDANNSRSFTSTLADAFDNLNSLQTRSSDLVQAYAHGQTTDIHSVMIAGQEASIALQMATQVRNKVVEAYQEVMRITL